VIPRIDQPVWKKAASRFSRRNALPMGGLELEP
jgi:hypothetical protein